jgi:hypothetical protein
MFALTSSQKSNVLIRTPIYRELNLHPATPAADGGRRRQPVVTLAGPDK